MSDCQQPVSDDGLRASGISCCIEAAVYFLGFIWLMYYVWLIPVCHKPQRTFSVCLFYITATVILISREIQMINYAITDLRLR